jgi:hypothetical protein
MQWFGDAIELHRLIVDRGNIIEGIHYFGDGVKDQLVAHTLSGALFLFGVDRFGKMNSPFRS